MPARQNRPLPSSGSKVLIREVQWGRHHEGMIEAWDAVDVRRAEEPLLAAGVPLMERASFALASIVARDIAGVNPSEGRPGRFGRRVAGARVVLLVGPGNNGGDALHAGAYLARRGARVRALCVAADVHPQGAAALRAAGGTSAVVTDAQIPQAVEVCAGADVVLDGLVGIGGSGALRGTAGSLVAAVNRALDDDPDRRPWVIAVDVASGIGVDDGMVCGPVLAADRTVTFGAAKPGLLLPPAAYLSGRCAVVDIGFEPTAPAAVRRLEPADVAALWPVPGVEDHKYTRGVLGVVAGTSAFPGAAVLVATAAQRAGAGMVRYRGPDDVTRMVIAARPEVVPVNGRVQAWTLGSGVPAAPEPGERPAPDAGPQHDRIRYALAAAAGELAEDIVERVPAVVDAGALSLLPPRVPPSVVLTPHAGELAVLLTERGAPASFEDVEAEPLRWARRAHELTGATVLLKGAISVVAGAGVTYAQPSGPGWLASAGSGDVLAGLLGTILAAHGPAVAQRPGLAADLAAAAVFVHGRAGARAADGGPVAALDVAHAIPATIAELLDE